MSVSRLLVRVVLTALLLALLPAGASASPLPPGAADGSTISKEAKRQAHIAADIARHLPADRLYLDYRTVDRYDHHDAKVRRRFAAGWYLAGRPLDHISTREWTAVQRYLPRRCTQCLDPAVAAGPRLPVPDAPSPCTGVSSVDYSYSGVPVPFAMVNATVKLNSCDTDTYIYEANKIAVLAGFTAALCAESGAGFPAAVVFGTVSALYALSADDVDHAQRRSSVQAVIVTTRYTLYTKVRPQ